MDWKKSLTKLGEQLIYGGGHRGEGLPGLGEGLPVWVMEELMNLPGLGEVSWSGEEVGCVT